MTVHERVSGVWKEVTEAHVKVSGAWKEISAGFVNVSGVWKQFYTGIAYSLPTVSEVIINPVSAAGVRVLNNGKYESGTAAGSHTVVYSEVSATAWVDPEEANIGDAYHCRLVTGSGSLDVGTADTWLALTSDRTFEAYEGSGFTGTMQLSIDGGSTVLTTGAVTLAASPL